MKSTSQDKLRRCSTRICKHYALTAICGSSSMTCDFCGLAECDCPHPNLSKPALNCEGCDKPIANEDNYAVMLNDQNFHFCSLKCMREWTKECL